MGMVKVGQNAPTGGTTETAVNIQTSFVGVYKNGPREGE
jgi:hypothetical protein